MDVVTSYGNISPRTAAYASKRMLKTARHVNSTAKYAQVEELPKNAGDTLKLRRYEDWPVTESPLSEIVDPAAITPTFVDIEVTVEEYGQVMRLTKKIADMHEDPVFRVMQEKAGKSAGKTSQKIDFNALKAGTNVYYASTYTTRATCAATVANNDLKKIVRQLNKDGVEPITKRIAAGTGIATEPVPEAFVAFGHTDTKSDLENLDGWLPVHEYSNPASADEGEVGECEGIRFILNREAPIFLAAGASGTTYLSNGVKPSSSSAYDVYPLIIIGQDVWSRVPLAGETAIKPMVVNPGKPSAADPTGRKGFISWVAYFASVITWEQGVARYEMCVTAL